MVVTGAGVSLRPLRSFGAPPPRAGEDPRSRPAPVLGIFFGVAVTG